jgi:COX assembly mitochondrial protein 2
MHPPLDRPHPLCQAEIDALKECHASQSKLKFWQCNDLKFALDKCFKAEKQELLKTLNADYEEKRKREDDALQEAIGHKQSFEDFLKTDPTYLREKQEAQSTNTNGKFSKKSQGSGSY